MRPETFVGLLLCAALIASAGCGPCVHNDVESTAVATLDGSPLEMAGVQSERDSTVEDWECAQIFADHISKAPARSQLWGVLGYRGELTYAFGFRLRTPRAQGELLAWDPTVSQFEQEFALTNAREFGWEDDDIIREATEATLEVISVSPPILRVDALYTPTATSSATDAKRLTGDIHFREVGNSLICET